MKITMIALCGVALMYAAVVAFFFFAQRSMVFPAPQDYRTPNQLGLEGVREEPLATADGARVMVWQQDAAPGMPTIIYFPGNADSISNLGDLFAVWRAAGWGAAVLSYRSYPGSTGEPTETALRADALALYARLRAGGINAEGLVIAGYSLGSAVAVNLASERPAHALLLLGALSAADDVAKRAYPFLPVRTLMKDRFRSIDRIGLVKMPVYLVHGAQDRVAPLDLAERLYQAAPGPKDMVVLEHLGHGLPPDAGWSAFLAFLAQHTGGGTSNG